MKDAEWHFDRVLR